jgi:hypothetical protein
MKSFSAFKPVVTGTPAQVKAYTFAMWLRANILNIQKPFNPETWRVAKPWLSFQDVEYQKKLYSKRSLGAMLIGNIQISDEDVFKAVDYEALATKQISTKEIRKMILSFYDFSRMHSISKREVLNNINKEFAHLDKGFVSERSKNWKIAIMPYVERAKCTLKPKIHEHELAKIIMQVFEKSEQKNTIAEIHKKITPILLKISQPLPESSPILRRALDITGLNLTPNSFDKIIKNITQKYYIKHPLAKESLERFRCVIRQYLDIPIDSYIWSLVDLNIAPKHDWNEDTYEEALEEKYHDPPQINNLQEPFMKYVLPFKYVRKKQNIPWQKIIKLCTRAKGTDDLTIQNVNTLIKKYGFVPYNKHHKVFDIIRVQGLQLRLSPSK